MAQMDTCGVFVFQLDSELEEYTAFIEVMKQGFSPSWKRETLLILQSCLLLRQPQDGHGREWSDSSILGTPSKNVQECFSLLEISSSNSTSPQTTQFLLVENGI